MICARNLHATALTGAGQYGSSVASGHTVGLGVLAIVSVPLGHFEVTPKAPRNETTVPPMPRAERVHASGAFVGLAMTGATRPCTIRRPKRSFVGALLGTIALVVSACGGSSATSPQSTTTTPPVIPSAAGPPGTSLGDGFAVVEGTTLIGDPIPIGVAVVYQGEPILDDGWTATSIVDGGDPIGIVDAYMRQAEKVGLAEQPGTGCTSDIDVAICSAFARSADPAEPRSVSATVVRGLREDVLSDHVIVRFSTTDLYWEYGQVRRAGDADLAIPASTAWPPLKTVGEPLGTAGETTHAVVLQDGSRLAGPPRLNLNDVTGGIVAILEVTGDPRSVLQTYLDHLAELGLAGAAPEVLEIGDAVVTRAYPGEAGGDSFAFTLVERPGRPTWLAIESSHD